MSLKEKIINYISSKLEEIKPDILWHDCEINFSVNQGLLIQGYEALYYKELIEKNKSNQHYLNYISLLNDDCAKISQVTYLYLIYYLDKEMNKKNDSHDNFNNMFI